MKKKISPLLFLLFSSLALASPPPGNVHFEDDFRRMDSEQWVVTRTPGARPASPDWKHRLRLFVTSSTNSQRTFITSQSSAIDPFLTPVEVKLEGLALIGAAPEDDGASMFFVIVGKTNNDAMTNYFPTVEGSHQNYNESGGALGLTVRRNAGGVVMEVFDYGNGFNSTSVAFDIEGIPTDIRWTIDGTGSEKTWEIQASGLSISGSNRFSLTKAGTFNRFTRSEVSRLSLGSMNYGGKCTDGSKYLLERVRVAAPDRKEVVPNAPTDQELRAAEEIVRRAWMTVRQPSLDFLLHAPAGKHGFVQVDPRTKRLVFEDGTPASFFGVAHRRFANAGNKQIDPTEMEEMLNELRSLGVNQIRIQLFPTQILSHMKNGKGAPDELNPTVMANLDRFLSLAKDRGIYIHLNMTMPGITEGPYSDTEVATTGELLLNEHALEIRKKYMKALLDHVNPHTGLAYKEEPAIMALQLGNEMPVYSRAWGGVKGRHRSRSWAPMTKSTRDQLTPRWNEFLLAKYASRQEVAKAWGDLLKPAENPATGSVALTEPFYPVLQEKDVPTARERDANDFANSLLAWHYREMKRFLREEVGASKHLISDNAWIRGSEGIRRAAHSELELMNLQHYWPHLSYGRFPDRGLNLSPLKDFGQLMIKSLLTGRVSPDGKVTPFDITEYGAHLDSGNPGEVYPVHSVFARTLGADGQMAWIYWSDEEFWQHWFAFNKKRSPLPQQLTPFAAASLIWRQDIPESDVLALARLFEHVQGDGMPAPVAANIDRDDSVFEGINLKDPHFSPAPGLINLDWPKGRMTIDEASWCLFIGQGEFKGKSISFTPAVPGQRYIISVVSLDGSPLQAARRIRLFVNAPGRIRLGDWADKMTAVACGRFEEALRTIKPVNGYMLAHGEDHVLFYDFISPSLGDGL